MIEIREMQTGYGSEKIFTIGEAFFEQGKIASVIGPNGSGKTTLLRTIAGLSPYRGSIRICEKESRDYTGMERARKVAYLPQLVKTVNMDVETLVSHGRFPYHGSHGRRTQKDLDRIDYALKLTRLESFRKRNLSELSGGELRRAWLAMAIAQDTPMLLLDEPTTYMDLTYQSLFYKILRELASQGKGILMVCHDLEQSFTFSDTIALVQNRTMKHFLTTKALMQEEQTLRETFGVSLKKSSDPELLFPYLLKK